MIPKLLDDTAVLFGEPRMRGDDPVLDTAMHQQIM